MGKVAVHLRYARVAPRKARTVVDMIRGKGVAWAEAQLGASPKKAARLLRQLLKSAVAAAKEHNLSEEKLVILEAIVNEGPRLKRFRPHFRGMVRPFNREMSHITLTVSDEPVEITKSKTKAAARKS